MGRAARQRRQRRKDRRTEAEGIATPAAEARPRVWPRLAATAVALLGLAGGTTLFLLRLARTSASGPPTMRADAAVGHVEETEPNDAPAQAQPIGTQADVLARWQPGDVDVFAIAIEEPGGFLLHARVDDRPGARLVVTDAAGKAKAEVAAPAEIRALGVGRGRYYVSVSGGVGDASGGTYRLAVRLSPAGPGSEWEPDDDPRHAEDLATEKPKAKEIARYRVAGWWSHPDDMDCFKVPLMVPPQGAVLRLELHPPAGVTPRLRVLDSGDEENQIPPRLLAETEGAAPGATAILPALGARSWESRYYACTAAAVGENFADRYRLEVSAWTPEEPFEFEPNDAPEAASALPRDTTVVGYLPTSDVDWYRISAAPEPSVRVTVDVPADVAAELVLYSEPRRELSRRSGAAGERLTLEAAGVTFAAVRPLGGGSVAHTYRISTAAPDRKAESR